MHAIALRLHAGHLCREKLITWDENARKEMGEGEIALLVEPTQDAKLHL